MRLLMLKGLPASGKTTFAKKLVSGDIHDYGQNWVRVNKDDMRAMLHNGKWSREREKKILELRDQIISDALFNGQNVVVDDTNFAPKHEEQLQKIARKHGAIFLVKMFDTPIETCIKRDLQRPNSVGEKVIRQMHDQYLKPPQEFYVPVSGTPRAVICDIDGTLAHMVDRGPHDYDRVEQDACDEVIADLLSTLVTKRGYEVILVSGRPDTCKKQTEEWLKKHGIEYHRLFMRDHTRVDNNGNMVSDTVIKREIFDRHIRNSFNIQFVLDDRDRVVEMWRQMGLKVFQVAPGDF